MAFMLPLIFTLLLIFLSVWWKNIRLIIKFWSYDKKRLLLEKNTAEIYRKFQNLANEYRKQGKNIFKYRIMGKIFVWPLNGKTVAKIVESTTELYKGDDYRFFDQWLGGGLLLLNGPSWKAHRKMLTPTFHFAKLEGYMEVFNSGARVMTECLASNGATVDSFPYIKRCALDIIYIKRCALDIICEAAMGTRIDSQHNPNHPYVRAVAGWNELAMKYTMSPLLQIGPVFWALGYAKQKADYLYTMKQFTSDVIAERRAALESGEIEKETQKRKMNFLDILLSSGEANELTSEDIRQEVDTFMFAGHDTTTTSLSWVCWNLAHHQDIQEKVYEELVSVFGDDPNDDVTAEGISKLDYTERVLKESKRFVTPVPSVPRKLQNNLEIDGYIIPAEANVVISPMVLHDNPDAFPNPKKFDPDRFLPEQIAKRHNYDYLPFSAGLRNCIGQKFSQLNEKVMLIHLLKNFKIEPTSGFDGSLPCYEVITKPSNGIPVRLIMRIV